MLSSLLSIFASAGPALPNLPARPPLPPRPPSPPPPSPLAPSFPPSTRPVAPPAPPEPTTEEAEAAFNFSSQSDYINMTFNVPSNITLLYPASTLALVGSAIPIVTNANGEAIIATNRYYLGSVAAFGGEKMITECCRPVVSRQAWKRGKRKSDPGLDQLINNIVDWAARRSRDLRPGGKRFQKAVVRVSDLEYVRMAR